MAEQETRALTLKPQEERRLRRGHLWVYRNELERDPGLEDGAVVDVYAEKRRFVARGFYQASGGIAARLLTGHQQQIDAPFLLERLEAARAWRGRLFPGQNVYRWVFGESDGLPGLIIDRYGSVVTVNSSCAFYQNYRPALEEALLATEGVTGVVSSIQDQRATTGEVPPVLEVDMEGLRLQLDLTQTQKTGLFLDQRLNCRDIRPFVEGKRVLDGHAYHGVWSCHAAVAGAVEVIAADTSAAALEHARRNAALNGVADRCQFLNTEVESLLENNTYGVIVLDPPAYAKTRAQAKKALSRYLALNANAMKALEPGGVLVTSSCSHFISEEDFAETIKRAAKAAHRQVWEISRRGASPDHPVLLQMPETRYLKCLFLRVL